MTGGKPGRITIKKYLISFAMALLICVLAVMISCAIVISAKDPDELYIKSAYAALIVASLCSGFTAVRITKNPMSGAIIGILLTLTFAIVSQIFFERTSDIGTSLLMHLAVIALSSVGGLLGRKKKSAKRRPKKRIKRKM